MYFVVAFVIMAIGIIIRGMISSPYDDSEDITMAILLIFVASIFWPLTLGIACAAAAGWAFFMFGKWLAKRF